MGIIINARARQCGRSEPRERTWARREFKTHTIQPAEVRAHTFRRASGDSNHWFRLTWTPGHLSLVGDIGEMTLTHYSALATFEGGVRWAARADYDYLMGKSDKVTIKELDRAETARDIIGMMADAVAYSRVHELREARRHRRAVQAATAHWEQDLGAWHLARPEPGHVDADSHEEERPRLTDHWPEIEPRARFARMAERDWGRARSDYFENEVRKWAVPEGWGGWLRLMIAVEDDLSFDDPNALLTPAGRREVRAALASKINADMHEGDVAELCRDLGFDDYYGTYRYSPRTIWQIEAIQHGCNLILDQLEPSRTWARAWSDPVV